MNGTDRRQSHPSEPFCSRATLPSSAHLETNRILAGVCFEALLGSGFAGQVYPVNPAVTELHGQRCYSTRARPSTGG